MALRNLKLATAQSLDSVAYTVYATTNYAQFKLAPSNRAIIAKHVEDMMEAILKKDLLATYPIVVTADMTIVDGQHRFEAARQLMAPLYYLKANEALIADVPGATALTKPWSPGDHLHYWCTHNAQEYLMLQEFLNDYPFFSTSYAADVCTSSGIRTVAAKRMFQTGQYQCDNMEEAFELAEAAIDFHDCGVRFARRVSFMRGLRQLLRQPGYDHGRMLNKLSYMASELQLSTNLEGYLDQFEHIYNYNQRGKTRARFSLRIRRDAKA